MDESKRSQQVSMPTSKKKSNKKSKKRSEKSSVRKQRKPAPSFTTTIAPWLCVRGGSRAVEFYKSAFGAVELFRIGDGDSVVARLAIDGAEFWMSDESPEHQTYSPESLG